VLFEQLELEGAEVARLVDVGDGAHQRADDELGVVLEEVDLHHATVQVEDNGRACAEPLLQARQPRQLVRLL